MLNIVKVVFINTFIFVSMLAGVEVFSFLQLENKGNTPRFLYSSSIYYGNHLEEVDADCKRMTFHPVLTHVHNDNGGCNIKGGFVEGNDVLYHAESRDENSKYVVMLGGSTLDGFYQHYSNGNTIPYLLSGMLKSNNVNIGIINAATGGYSSTHEMIKLITEVVHYKKNIKAIISYNGINDTSKYYSKHRPSGKISEHPMLSGSQYFSVLQNKWPLLGPQKLYSKFFPSTQQYFMSYLRETGGAVSKLGAKQNFGHLKVLNAFNRWKFSVKMMKSISDNQGIPYYVILQPTMGLVLNEATINLNSNDGKMYIERDKSWKGDFKALRELYVKFAKECGLLDYCIDISTMLPATGDMYSDPRHPNEDGNRIISKVIFNRLDEKLNFKDLINK